MLKGNVMGDFKRTKPQLIRDLMKMRKTIDALEASRSKTQKAEKKYCKKLIEYEKLSAIGRLTANVAHEIRNSIAVTGGFAKRLERSLSPGTQKKGIPGADFHPVSCPAPPEIHKSPHLLRTDSTAVKLLRPI